MPRQVHIPSKSRFDDRSRRTGKGSGSIGPARFSSQNLQCRCLEPVHTGFQPHGLVVDDARELVYVAHRNVNSSGPPPHHSTECAGRNGYVTMIDLNTLELVSEYKVEVSVDPYSVALRN